MGGMLIIIRVFVYVIELVHNICEFLGQRSISVEDHTSTLAHPQIGQTGLATGQTGLLTGQT